MAFNLNTNNTTKGSSKCPPTTITRADTLTQLAPSKTPPRHIVLHKVLMSPTMDRPDVLQAEVKDKGWITPIWN
ncbi:hypothetical protein CR513_00726, partial [Mucuna pruriens]